MTTFFAWCQEDGEAKTDGDANPLDEILSKAHNGFDKGKEELQEKFRKNFAGAILEASSVEVFILDFEMVREVPDGKFRLGEDDPTDDAEEADWTKCYFRILPYEGSYARVLQRKKLKGRVLEEGKKAIAHQLKQPDEHSSAFCHYPIYGLRVTDREGSFSFQTSLCYVCGNYFFVYPDDFRSGSWIDLNSKKLETFLKKEMPIPQKELDRFKAKYGPKKKKTEKE